jgi:hypothetical protein
MALLTVADFLQAACSFITSFLNSAQTEYPPSLAALFFHSFMTFSVGLVVQIVGVKEYYICLAYNSCREEVSSRSLVRILVMSKGDVG